MFTSVPMVVDSTGIPLKWYGLGPPVCTGLRIKLSELKGMKVLSLFCAAPVKGLNFKWRLYERCRTEH
jgi:hypothetical protein